MTTEKTKTAAEEKTEATEIAETERDELDPWAQTKEIFLERGQATEEQCQFVCVNGRTFQVPKGKSVSVPLPVYEVLENARRMREEAFQRAKQGV